MIAEQKGNLADVKKRGRWKTDSSVRRYEKSGLLQKTWLELAPTDQRLCKRAAARLPRRLEQLAQEGVLNRSERNRPPSSLTCSEAPLESLVPSSAAAAHVTALTPCKDQAAMC